YQKTVLTAFQEVENALVAFVNEQRHRQTLQEAIAAERKSLDLANLLYREGLTDFLNVLVAQNALYSSQAAAVQSDTAIATNLVALYQALGGGWETVPTQPPTIPVVPSQENNG
ncbi:MAG TPA: TolC family protein, partial [Candidatus Methylomirabilis sp.]|nr:TolC family protein [Candidatus Methylomirabilis sp.]